MLEELKATGDRCRPTTHSLFSRELQPTFPPTALPNTWRQAAHSLWVMLAGAGGRAGGVALRGGQKWQGNPVMLWATRGGGCAACSREELCVLNGMPCATCGLVLRNGTEKCFLGCVGLGVSDSALCVMV
jgi:hypothetical protein